jgi:FKBP-type peptidyl-prolyl cis-trans isomerase FkpA
MRILRLKLAFGLRQLFSPALAAGSVLLCATLPAEVANATASPAPALIREDIKVGTGPVAKRGQLVTIQYAGWLYDPQRPQGRGTPIDSSVERKATFSFQLGQGEVIRGWDEGFVDMKVGGKRKLIIPAALAYGDRGAGAVIPPNADLMYEVELLSTAEIKKDKPKPQAKKPRTTPPGRNIATERGQPIRRE